MRSRHLALVLALFTASAASARLAHADRPDDPNTTELFRFDAGDVIETYDSAGRFKLHYTRAGKHAVPLTDADNNGIPDRVETLAALYDEVAAFYVARGFLPPLDDGDTSGGVDNNGGDDRFDVYLVDFGHSADGAFRREKCDANGLCSGFIVQENDFAGYGYPSRTYGDRVLASHEFFHAVQAAYDNNETTIFSEGTAVWATEQFDATLDDLEGFVDGYLMMPDRSIYLPQTGPVDAFSYGASIFFQYLGEAYGAEIIHALLVASAGPDVDWFTALDTVLAANGSSFAEAFVEFATWNLYTDVRANPTASYAHGDEYPLVKTEAVSLPSEIPMKRLFPSATYYVSAPTAGRTTIAARALLPEGNDGTTITLGIVGLDGAKVGTPVVLSAATKMAVQLDVGTSSDVIFYFVNTAKSGESLRPTLCLGSVAEVDACVAKNAPTEPPVEKDGGCAASGSSRSNAGALALVVLALCLLRRKSIILTIATAFAL